jgi:hypothetical protein
MPHREFQLRAVVHPDVKPAFKFAAGIGLRLVVGIDPSATRELSGR